MQTAAKTVKNIVIILFALIIVYLTVLSGFSTAAINANEHTYLISDSIWRNTALETVLLLILGTAAYFLGRRSDHRKRTTLHFPVKWIVLGLEGVLALAVVVCLQKEPRADQLMICEIAEQWSNGVFSSLDTGAYLDVYPNQAGIVLFLYFFGILFGYKNYLAFQLLNVLALLQTVRMLISVSDLSGESSARGAGIAISCLLFLPCTLYSTFVYGTLIGLALAVTAFRDMLYYISGKKGLPYAFGAVICIFLAVTVKQNYLIFGIAMILYVLYILVRDRFRIRLLPFLLALILALTVNSAVVGCMVHRVTGRRLGEGMSSLSWVSMGIKEGSPLYDGWWDVGFSTTVLYAECNYDREAQKEVSIERIKERIREFRDHPGYGIRFFAGKQASQWNNPDFQGWWINAVMPQAKPPVLLDRLLAVHRYNTAVFRFLNAYQFVALCGVLIYLCLRERARYRYSVLPDSDWRLPVSYGLGGEGAVYFCILFSSAADVGGGISSVYEVRRQSRQA